MSESINKLLNGNVEWVDSTRKQTPDFFEKLSAGQSPDFLWIGCSDSRVPATQITNTLPGSIFVHRNIANMVIHTDFNLLSVISYAVNVLKIKHIIVCGHYDCGGISAAMTNEKFGFLDNWLAAIKNVYSKHHLELDAISDTTKRANRFVELNIQEQVLNLARISFIQDRWALDSLPLIHGWVYNIHDGLIKDLNVTINSTRHLQEIFRYSQ